MEQPRHRHAAVVRGRLLQPTRGRRRRPGNVRPGSLPYPHIQAITYSLNILTRLLFYFPGNYRLGKNKTKQILLHPFIHAAPASRTCTGTRSAPGASTPRPTTPAPPCTRPRCARASAAHPGTPTLPSFLHLPRSLPLPPAHPPSFPPSFPPPPLSLTHTNPHSPTSLPHPCHADRLVP